MAVSDLTFTKDGNLYKASFVSAGKQTVQIERAEKGSLDIKACIEGMTPTGMPMPFQFYNSANMLFEVETQPGVNVTVLSGSQVTSAKILTE